MNIFLDTDINLIKKYVYADSNSLSYLKKMLDYRNLRTEQAYYAELAYRYDNYEFGQKQPKEVIDAGEFQRDMWRDKLISLDKKRRGKHNEAIAAFKSFLEIGEKNNLDYIYVGPMLSPEQAEKYMNAEYRAVITDAIFKILHSIEEASIKKIKENDKTAENYENLKGAIDTFDKEYGVKKSILFDEDKNSKGGIEFYNMSFFDGGIF